MIADREIGFDDAKLFAQGNKNDSPDGGRATAASHGHGLDHNQMWTCTNDSTDTLAPIAADDSEGGGTESVYPYTLSFHLLLFVLSVIKLVHRRDSNPTPCCAKGER